MWGLLAAAVAVLLLFMYIPGYLFLRGLGRTRCDALALAPAFSVAGSTLLAVAFAQVGISSSWLTLMAPLAAAGLLVFLVGLGRSRRRRMCSGKGELPSFLAYLIAGIVAVLLLYVAPLGVPDAFVCGNDYAHHLNVVKSFVDSGNWSTLDVTAFPNSEGAYYPAANSVVSALPVSCLGVSVPIALNATNIVMAGFIFPLGMWAFMARIFGKTDARLYAGALCSMIILVFPWEFFRRSVILYANELGLVLMPAFMASFMDCLKLITRGGMSRPAHARDARGGKLGSCVLVAAVAIVAIGLAHPCAFFSAMLFVIAYVAHAIAKSQRIGTSGGRVCAVCVWIALCIAAWALASQLPFMRDVVDYSYDARFDVVNGIVSVLTLWSPFVGAQYILGVVLIIGLAACAVDERRRWVLVPYAIAAALSLACLVLSPGACKSLLSGFWYNHSPRLLATAAVFAVPILAQGMAALMDALAGLLRVRSHCVGPVPCSWQEIVAALALVVVIGFVPLPLGGAVTMYDYGSMMANSNDPDAKSSFLTLEEREFLDKAVRFTDGEGLVLNAPHDGSGYAYGLCGMNTMVRSFYPITDEDELMVGRYVDKVASNSRVRQAVESLGARYVLRLDEPVSEAEKRRTPVDRAIGATVQVLSGVAASAATGRESAEQIAEEARAAAAFDKPESTIYGVRFEITDWAGILSVRDDTPGFEVVLAQDDMRLYRII